MTPETQLIVDLMILFTVKHFVCDFLLQNRYMLGKFNRKGWVLPLSAHCGVHAGTTFVIMMACVTFPQALLLAVFDFITHFAIDKWKVEISRNLNPAKDAKYWHYLGADQFAHSIIHILLILQAASFIYD